MLRRLFFHLLAQAACVSRVRVCGHDLRACCHAEAEHKDDETKEEYCSDQFDQSEDRKKALTRQLADLETLMAEAKDRITGAEKDIAALTQGVSVLNKSVAAVTEQRRAENAESSSRTGGGVQLLTS